MTQPPNTLTCTVTVQASPHDVWGLVADLPGMGRFSPENTGGWWLPGVRGPAVGARFLGTNRNGWRRWFTLATVVESVPGRRFTFDVVVPGMRVSRWSFDVEPSAAGIVLRQTWTFGGGRMLRVLGPAVTGRRGRHDFTTESMSTTLARVRDEAERARL